LILLQDLFDPFQKRPQLLSGARLLLAIARWLAGFQDLLQRWASPGLMDTLGAVR